VPRPGREGAAAIPGGFERPASFPDFVDCRTATPEPDIQWRAVITNGGPARGFSDIMPAFKDLLTPDQIGKVIEHLRSLCTEQPWPRGNLNLPRAIVTEKAFPEDEVVIGASFNAQGAPGVGTSVVYEKRIGATGQLEAAVPMISRTRLAGGTRAFGDIVLGYKQKLFHSLRSGSIVSVAAR